MYIDIYSVTKTLNVHLIQCTCTSNLLIYSHVLSVPDKCIHYITKFFVREMCIFCRTMIQDILQNSGLKDPHNYLPKELDGWDVWNIDDRYRRAELRKMVDEWLDK